MKTTTDPGASPVGTDVPSKWDVDAIPDQSGRTFVITGANSGLGLETAKALASSGARVVMAVRNTRKGEEAASGLDGRVEVSELDLGDLASVRGFAERFGDPIDVLINNAGLMAVPQSRTKDGFETQFGVNHLGHFALTGLLLDRIGDRVVTLSSAAHKIGKIRLDDPNWEGSYQRWPAYGQSKLANLMFAKELQRRLVAAGSPLRSMAAHPGYAATNLQSRTESIQDRLMGIGNLIFAQSARMGALPTLYAAVAPDLPGGSYVGPGGLGEQRGHPKVVEGNSRSQDTEVASRLWELSEELTGVRFTMPATGAAV
ncbi:SDR family NAD(P)-dependent oxidoreductase [Thermoleophilia bacterium SCSIO 60948]|nr:SDR family NAD(P)-dependent oxidoreductase [Thermoleophilia bacterium SCSIO 60948]